MAERVSSMPPGRETTPVPAAHLCSNISRLPPDVEAGAGQVVPGVGVVAETIERMLTAFALVAGSGKLRWPATRSFLWRHVAAWTVRLRQRISSGSVSTRPRP